MPIPICKICKEPVWSFICSDCLATDLKRSISKQAGQAFSDFYRNFLFHFHSDIDTSFDFCLRCKALRPTDVCTFCCINEAVSWLKAEQPAAAHSLERNFVFHFHNEGFKSFFVNRRFLPITKMACNPQSEGMCDSCGEYAEILLEHDGEWLCNDCTAVKGYEAEDGISIA